METSSSSVFGQIDRLIEEQARSGDFGFSLPASVVHDFEENGVKSDELARIVGSKNEIISLVEHNQTLPPALMDRVSRLAHIVSLAETVFGKREKAFLWLRLRNEDLNNKAPIELLDREAGARIVEDALMRIEYGVSA